jgi:hypothetical protein
MALMTYSAHTGHKLKRRSHECASQAGSAGIPARHERRRREDAETLKLKVEKKRKMGSVLRHALAGRDARAPGFQSRAPGQDILLRGVWHVKFLSFAWASESLL